MNPSETFAMLRERISHSFIDGRLLTAGGPGGEEGLRRLLCEPFVLEELTARLVGLFRIGEQVLGLDASVQAFGEKREQATRLVAAVRASVASEKPNSAPPSLRAIVLEIRSMLSEMGSAPEILVWSRPPLASHGASLCSIGERLERIILDALETELQRERAGELARKYWAERTVGEEEAIAAHSRLVGAEVVVSDSVEDILWTLRTFDDVAGVALATRGAPDERRARCERMLGGAVADRLAELTISLAKAPTGPAELE